ncbi:MAG: molybdopterin-dependent oxidoreductase [Gelidibacter sp.]|uniref:molybdopterin-dependent oxidoreductase n=1 Tax=Gelidibacter sp. TaxID=2018083 RepID=UPI0032640C8E
MIPHFTEAEKAVHYPEDRRFHLGMKPYMKLILLVFLIGVIGAAWLQYLVFGLPSDPSAVLSTITPNEASGFPIWVNLSHWVNFFFLMLIIRSGLSILFDHPRLYWNNSSDPEKQWIRFTPLKIPKDKFWTAKEDARYISPIAGLPGYKHTVGIARVWHFLTVPFFVLNGAVFIFLLFYTNQWQRLVPVSWQIVPDAWNVFVHYATFNFPFEPNGFYHYNAIQQLSYFGTIFILAPLAMLTGMAMSPAIENRFHWYPKLFGNRQSARSIHFLVLIAFSIFIIIHISLIAATGLVRNMNHIVLGTDNAQSYTGLYIGIAIILSTIAFAFLAHWLSWHKQRSLQYLQASINGRLWKYTINRFKVKKNYQKKDITSYFWLNGKEPDSAEWRNLAQNNFADYKLKIEGLVENPVELSLADLKQMGKDQNITMHHCIQGWSGIAEWGGLPLSKIIALVKPNPEATTVAFFSFGEGLYGGTYYDTHTLDNCLKPDSILAWEMNYEPLSIGHGAPLRLRVENQLGYKMVKWIERIEFVKSVKDLGKGFGGKNEDDEYFDLLADS